MKQEIKRFLLAVGYFTRIPIPAWVGYAPDELNRSARYFPLVGAIIGILSAAMLVVTAQFLPASLAVLLSMVFSLLLTGGFHEDGLADSADGFGGGWQKADVLRIMKDSRIGSFGSLALLMALLIKFSALQALATHNTWLAVFALISAHPLSRLAALWVMGKLCYVRDDEGTRAKPVAEGISSVEITVGSLCGLLPVLLLAGLGIFSITTLIWVLCVGIALTLLCARYFLRRLGGYTGDCLGAVQQVTELGIYITLCATSLT